MPEVGISDGDLLHSDASRKRSRPILSCLECRRKKLKCDRTLPCNQCRRLGRARLCAFSDGVEPLAQRESESNESENLFDARPSKTLRQSGDDIVLEHTTNGLRLSTGTVEELQSRVSKLEAALAAGSTLHSTVVSPIPGDGVNGRDGQQVIDDEGSSTRTTAPLEAETTATFAIAFPEVIAFAKDLQSESGEYADLAEDLRTLHSGAKPASQGLSVNGPETTILMSMISRLPEREVCKKLVDLYFDNFETYFRILHRPSFITACERFRTDYNVGFSESDATLPSLLAVLSISSTLETLSDCDVFQTGGFDGHRSVPQLIEVWLDTLPSKNQYSFSILQVRTLMTVLQLSEATKIGDIWVKTGKLMRHGMIAGLSSLSSEKSPFQNELETRLWTTIIELDLFASVLLGMPLSLAHQNLGLQRLANLNDEDMTRTDIVLLPDRPLTEWTDSLCQRVLADSLQLRLDACAHMTGSQTKPDFRKAQRYAKDLEAILQNLPSPLRFSHGANPDSSKVGQMWSKIVVDVILRRSLLNLYNPFALASIENPRYEGARIPYIQSCMILLCYQDLFDPKFSELTDVRPEGYWDLFYQLFGSDMIQTTLGVCSELKRLGQQQVFVPDGDSNAVAEHDTNITSEGTRDRTQITSWTIPTLIKTIEDSIEPMRRRFSRRGPNLKDLICLQIAFQASRNDHTTPDIQRQIVRNTVQNLVVVCKEEMGAIDEAVCDEQERSTGVAPKTHASGKDFQDAEEPWLLSDPSDPRAHWYWRC